MPSLAFKKLFRSKKDRKSGSDNTKNETSETRHISGAKAKIASLTNNFRRHTPLQVPATADPQSDVVFESQIADVLPLPHIPRVAGTLRRDLAHFKPLPLIHDDDSEDGSESASFVDITVVPPLAQNTPVATYRILRKPVSLRLAVNDQTLAPASPPAKYSIRRKPVPVTEVANKLSYTRTAEEDSSAQTAEKSCVVNQIPTAELTQSAHDGPNTLVIPSDAGASRRYSPTSNTSSSPLISLCQFPAPPALPRLQHTSPLALFHVRTRVQVARDAVYTPPTATDAQQALLDYADIYAASTSSQTNNDVASNGHSRGSSGDTALTLYTPPARDDWTPVESECDALTPMVSGFRLSRMTRDSRRQNDMLRALQSDKAKAVEENKTLKGVLAAANAIVRVERAKKELFRQHVDAAQEECDKTYKEKARLMQERDIARKMAEDSAAAARKSEDHNKELFGKIASREYHVCQAKIVLDNSKNFKLRTGHSPEEWYERAMVLTRETLSQRGRNEKCEAQVGDLASQPTKTAGVLAETMKALKKSETELWTFKHLLEEAGRALEMSQGMHKEANELVETLQKQVATQEVTLKVEQRCAERLLADAMRENATKDERIARLRSAISKTPESETNLPGLLDTATQQLSTLEEQTIIAQRSAEDVLELLGTEQAKSADLLQANRELENQLGRLQLELDIANDEKAVVQEELGEAHKDLEVTEENARLWQIVAEKRLDELLPEEQAEMKAHALEELRKQLEQAQQIAEYYRQKNLTVLEDAVDLEYELQLHQRRLANDAGQELYFYQTHWENVENVFDENEQSKARLEAFEERFAVELEREPLQLTRDPHAHKSFEEAIGPEFVAQTLAMMKGQAGSHDSEKPCLTEKVQGIYGFGPG